jgi:hypothetical protein
MNAFRLSATDWRGCGMAELPSYGWRYEACALRTLASEPRVDLITRER